MITFQEVKEKDLSILASLYSVISFDSKPEENWNNSTALSYLTYFYHLQPDLFLCAYDDDIPVGAVFSVLKPYWNGMRLSELEVFVSEDYRDQNIGKKLLENHFELAMAKYHVSSVNTVVHQDYLSWFQKIGLEAFYDRITLYGNIENCLQELKEN